ncbi:MAG: hypothetical protein HC836_10925 [Richelia sp. RM2_1_2]|nr:hypothetical protein [Richelia sp. SM1_7_0]NJN10761.1 hypothetical protein [Richelia sp. RM1_1_1]NJO26121.1 hypothetical protein [Richelia sp. SL_2_1]NJO58833.1 hypothetical protein [Richelia sp. RM2_1_2]
MRTTNNLLSQMREQVLKLNELQLAFEEEQDQSKKQAFVKHRDNYRKAVYELGKQDLASVLIKMKPLEIELNQAMKSLDNAIQSVNNTVNIISNIQSVSSIIARIFPIF